MLGPVVDLRDTAHLTAVVHRGEEEVARTDTPEALTGNVGDVLASMAETLTACGAAILAGDVVITGSVVPPLDVAAGETWTVAFEDLGRLSVSFAG
ncbi:MAG: hypothetical protein J2P22_06475 [Nocardioides sp.]|nr:hypothetical protein [Nocardioides sp.]